MSDSLQPFVFEGAGVRGAIVRLGATWRAVLVRRHYPHALREVMGELMAASALLASNLMFTGSMIMQMQGSGPVSILVVECSGDLEMRAMAHWVRINGVAATNLTVVASNDYIFRFAPPATGTVNVTWTPSHGIMDRSANSNVFSGAGFGYQLAATWSSARLPFLGVSQSSDSMPSNTAGMAVDGAIGTFSLTANSAGSYWLAQLARPFSLDRIELVNRSAPNDAELGGLTLRLFNLDDQIVFETVLTNPGSGGLAAINLPAGTVARSLNLDWPAGHTHQHRRQLPRRSGRGARVWAA